MAEPALQTVRKIGSASQPAIGLGCMNLCHAYGVYPDVRGANKLLARAVDLGLTHFDTAALYGFGRNETLVGQALRTHRDRVFLASKCGMTGVNGKRVIDGRPEVLKQTCEDALTRLRTDVIDLYYLHRIDPKVSLEDSIGALVELVAAGKVRHIGLSEVSSDTIRRAHNIYPLTAVQSEYSLWSRNAELSALQTCATLGVAFVAFSPLGRGFWANMRLDPAEFADGDIRRGMPRFQSPHFHLNAGLRSRYVAIANAVGCTPAQLALAWLLSRAPHIHVIPGTTSIAHLEENIGASTVLIDDDISAELDSLINPASVSGARYNPATLAEIDTERLPNELGDHANQASS